MEGLRKIAQRKNIGKRLFKLIPMKIVSHEVYKEVISLASDNEQFTYLKNYIIVKKIKFFNYQKLYI